MAHLTNASKTASAIQHYKVASISLSTFFCVECYLVRCCVVCSGSNGSFGQCFHKSFSHTTQQSCFYLVNCSFFVAYVLGVVLSALGPDGRASVAHLTEACHQAAGRHLEALRQMAVHCWSNGRHPGWRMIPEDLVRLGVNAYQFNFFYLTLGCRDGMGLREGGEPVNLLVLCCCRKGEGGWEAPQDRIFGSCQSPGTLSFQVHPA